ncbi:hypothetical protein [Sphingomonas sp.]|jgi:hypothetical protein|uniref:hypothetical protein n=1 Tax=Sphingomonas sp. TaxID=28214 RepID=UPI002E2F9A29|nr:hypothetical protein [Sphingomonas sp.]HEX4695101.1 hypothetical protein [Sphingomonas sp.]
MPAERSIWITALSTFSSTREKILEHRFVSDVTSELWRRGIFDFAVSHSEVDNSGYDLIIEAGSTVRHIQLKAMQVSGARRDFGLQLRLADKPSGCAVLMLHDPTTLSIAEYRLFAGTAGNPLPSLGDKAVWHTKGNALGVKAERPALRSIPISSFLPVQDTIALVDRLFGIPQV